ncbi:MAG: demethoxyubiquinone hydroxylase family protein [Pseudomonadota bacterium]
MTKRRSLPGDPGHTHLDIAPMIRVNHAGEYGARRIYQGQLAVLGKDPETRALLEHMAEQEDVHLAYFENQIASRHIRPTAFQPLWHVAGYALGYATAKMGRRAAMACTVAVESVISEHYQEQLDQLETQKHEKDLRDNIARFKAEEEEHHDIGLDNEAELTRGYSILTDVIKAGSKLAIATAKRF